MSCKLSIERNEGLHHWESKKQITYFFVRNVYCILMCVRLERTTINDNLMQPPFVYVTFRSSVSLLCLLVMPLCSACGARRVSLTLVVLVQFVPARIDEQFHDRLVSSVASDVFS